ncbi:MAG: DedA family protein [Caldisericia bacterium]|nr:DedA family protein [Caldisericia bacterium]
MSEIFHYILNLIDKLGYLGLFFAMVLNGSFIPISSEIFIIPAGYLASKGDFNLLLVILSGSLGSLCGSLINYFIGFKIGRPFIEKYGKVLRIKKETLDKGEEWFKNYGIYAVFFTKFIPTIRQYITILPGILKMNIINFAIFSFIGDIFVVTFMTLIGYFFGEYRDILRQYIDEIYIIFFTLILLGVIVYIFFRLFKKRKGIEKLI